MKYDFTGKTLFVTGAASGMGLRTAQRFALECGGNVMMADINEEALKQCAQDIIQQGGKADYVVCDVRSYEAVCAARDQTVSRFGSVDVLVNMAGGSACRIFKVDPKTEFADVPIEVYDWGLDVNLKGPFYCCHAMMKQMREQKSGVIINIGSIVGMQGAPTIPDYSTAKSGVMHGLTMSMATAGAPYNVRCVCVSPGPVLTRASMSNMKTVMGRAAEPDELVNVILFAASEDASFITGENIMVDGGRNVMRP